MSLNWYVFKTFVTTYNNSLIYASSNISNCCISVLDPLCDLLFAYLTLYTSFIVTTLSSLLFLKGINMFVNFTKL